MLSKMTNVILGLSVVVLIGALVWSSHRNAKSADGTSGGTNLTDASLAVASGDELLQAASSFDDPAGLMLLGDVPGASPDFRAQVPTGKIDRSRHVHQADGQVKPQQLAAAARMSPELINRCLEVANEIDADRGAKLSKLRDQDPQEFERVIHFMGPRLMAMAQLKQRDPDLYDMKLSELSQMLQVSRVAAELREANAKGSDGEISTLQEQLRGLLRIQLALSMKSRAEYLCRLEDQIKTLREQIDHDGRHFNETVEGKFRALTQTPVKVAPVDGAVTPPTAAGGLSQ